MDLTIAVSTHIVHEVNMREVILVDFLYKCGYGFFIGHLGHIIILQVQGKNVNFLMRFQEKCHVILITRPRKSQNLGAPFTLAIRMGLEPMTSTVTGWRTNQLF
jgi:hypothetical protein